MQLYETINIMSAGAEEGWGNAYYHVLPKLINERGYKIGAEIGVAYGGNSESILKNTNVDRLYSIDPYQPDWWGTDGYSLPGARNNGIISQGKNFGYEEYEELYLHAMHRLRKYNGKGERSIFLRDSSHAAWAKLQNEELDFVFIDAKHTYEDLFTDINLWQKRVRFGGIVSGHDYDHPNYPGIKRAVDQIFGTVNKEDGNIWWIEL